MGTKRSRLHGGKRTRVLAALVLLGVGLGRTTAPAEPPAGFVSLFDGKSLDGWTVENSTAGNFKVVDGVLRVEGPQGWLRSAKSYANFSLRVEFRFLTEDADSGVFLRAASPASESFFNGWPANSYQVQTREMSKNRATNPIWLGDIYRHRVAEPGKTEFNADAVLTATKKLGEWQTFEIEVIDSTLTVTLNGTPVTKAENLVNPRGHLGLQGEAGIVEYRLIQLRER